VTTDPVREQRVRAVPSRDLLRRPAGSVKPTTTRATADTVELFCRGYLPKGFRKTVERAQGARIKIKPCIDRTGFTQGFRAAINRPRRAGLPVLQKIIDTDRRFCVSCTDCAIDFDFANPADADGWFAYLRQNLCLKWSRGRRYLDLMDRGTVYWSEAGGRRNLILYRKTPCKIRLELRLLNARPVARADLSDPKNLAELNPQNLFARHMSARRRRACCRGSWAA
jgi:hypothetical protein